MSIPLHHIASKHTSPEEDLFDAILSAPTSFDLKSIQLLADGQDNLSLRVMLMLEGDDEWFLIRTQAISSQKAVFLAHSLLRHHCHHYPERLPIMERWQTSLNDKKVPFHGVSLIMGVN